MGSKKKVNRVRLSIGTGDDGRYGFTEALKKKIYERDDYLCRYCMGAAQCIDHIIPISYGRDHSEENLVACCNFCNLIVNNKIFDDFAHKRAYIINWYDKRLPKAASLVWDREEIMTLGYRLRQDILNTCIIVDTPEEAERTRQHLRSQRVRIVTDGDFSISQD